MEHEGVEMIDAEAPITEKELRQQVSEFYQDRDWPRLWFTVRLHYHARKNIPRGILRRRGAPEGKGSKQNWADYLALIVCLIPEYIILVMIFNCPIS